MTFISAVYVVFLAITYALWRLLPFARAKHAVILASLVFYAYWFPPFVLLFLLTGVLDFQVSRWMETYPSRRRLLLVVSVILNVAVLVAFKYWAFLNQLAVDLMALSGWSTQPILLSFILPIGISFYTFQSLSYTIDVYRGTLRASRTLADYLVFFTFFPHLVAGPIVRAADFLHQVWDHRQLRDDDVRFVVYRLARGCFLKMVIADNMAAHANAVFAMDPGALSPRAAWMGALAFAVQIFGDFAGYSDIAIGTARLFGFRLRENFVNPYWAFGIQDFWRRWHISLSTWFRDYVYFPLGGNRGSRLRTELNILFVFVLSGFWHGANWTFILWGFLNGLLVASEKLLRAVAPDWVFRSRAVKTMAVPLTLAAVVMLWVPFRSPSIHFTLAYWRSMLGRTGAPYVLPFAGVFIAGLFVIYLIVQVIKEYRSDRRFDRLVYAESLVYFTAVLTMAGRSTDFIYFQF